MQLTDVAELIERTMRITDNAPDFVVEAVEPFTFAGQPGFRVRYRYTADDLVHRGEARGSIVGGKLYLINFCAPALYYFDHAFPSAETIMNSAKVG